MRIALIAHDAKKKLMQNFCIAYRGILAKNDVCATGTTGRLVEEVTNLSIHKLLAGHLGGMQQIGAQIELTPKALLALIGAQKLQMLDTKRTRVQLFRQRMAL